MVGETFHWLSLFCLPFLTADDMGLGKTLTMISLILSKKAKGKEEDEKNEEKKLEKWISKNGILKNLCMMLKWPKISKNMMTAF